MSEPFNTTAAASRPVTYSSRAFSQGAGVFVGSREAPPGYEIVGPCGNGSFSEICKVRCRETGTFFALKRLRPEWPVNMEVAKSVDASEVQAAIIRSLRYAGQES